MNTNWEWNGARWWKFDFHTHTPASDDYGKGADQAAQAALKARTPKEWLLDYMRAGIDCVVVTDHNTGVWIDRLKQAMEDLKTQSHADFRPIHLFPGVEISVNGGIHLLAILACEKGTSDIDTLLGAAGFTGVKGSSNAVTTKSFVEVVSAIVAAGGIAIPAHVDEEHGLFKQTGTTLQQALDCDGVFSMESVVAGIQKPGIYVSKKLNWTEVLGSDAHHPSGNSGQKYPGSRFTWVKMGSPGIEGLRLALLDGSLSVLRSDAATDDPNQSANMAIDAIEVSQARYMGRPDSFEVLFNPWLNAVIGGRGTGKSTLVEFLRLALRRDGELPDALRGEFEKYGQVYADREDGGLLTNNAALRVVYRKDGGRFRIQWDSSGSLDPIQVESDGAWQRAEGDIRQRFPVRIYSQKQIFQLAKTPLALLRVVDEAPEVDYPTLRKRLNTEETQFLSLRAKIREIDAGLSEEARLRGELEDVKRKLTLFEQSGHAETLKTLQTRRRQQHAVEEWGASIDGTGKRLRGLAEEIVPELLDESHFDTTCANDAEILATGRKTRERLNQIAARIQELAEEADRAVAEWRDSKDKSAWKAASDGAIRAYDTLMDQLKNQGAGDPSGYGQLVQRRQIIEKQLKDVQDRKKQIGELKKQAGIVLERVAKIRQEITQARSAFLRDVLKDNPYVRIEVAPYGAKDTVETDIRQLLQRESGGFEKDIGKPGEDGMIGLLYQNDGTASTIEGSLARLKDNLRRSAANPQQAGVADKRFATHLAKLPPETFDRLDLWFPEDSLDVQYCTPADRQTFRPIQEGSPGQKTAALLAFLLSYGSEPLVLDQPEDDLDNHLIYGLIVAQLREIKRRRQVIVVTHNANIVVNGDAELVVALAARGGRTQVEALGCLQDRTVRQTICTVMEGGAKAFEQRYRRIALEGRHV